MSDTASGRSRTEDPVGTEIDSADPTRSVGVLSTHTSKETKAILNAVRALGHRPVWIRDENVTSWIEDGTVRFSPDVDVLVNRLLVTKSDQPLEDLHLADLFAQHVPVVNPPGAVKDTLHKYSAGAKLAAAGLPVPDAFFGRAPQTFENWERHLPDRAAHKRTIGTNGRDMSVVTAEETPNPKIRNRQSFVQEFLDTGEERPSDLRVYVVGDEVVGGMRRRAPEGEWRTNVALGGEVTDVTHELGPEPRRIATEAVDVLGLDTAGVDLMAVDGEWYVLEVNATAGFRGLFDATSTSPAPYIAALAIERVGGTVSETDIEAEAETLDDSTPDARPERTGGDTGNAVLGYTSQIRISGTEDVVSTVAKADTGARRTSIDTDLAGQIGAGPMVGTTEVRSAGHTETRPLVEVDLRVDGTWRSVTASVADRSEMRFSVLLGRDVLKSYTLDVSQRVEE